MIHLYEQPGLAADLRLQLSVKQKTKLKLMLLIWPFNEVIKFHIVSVKGIPFEVISLA